MAKRVLFAVVSAALGAIIGLLIHFLGAGQWVVPACAAAGALLPILLGPPGK
jgi:hypothetical protein